LFQASFLVLITLANEGTKTISADHKPVALLCIGCSLIASSVLLLIKSFWKISVGVFATFFNVFNIIPFFSFQVLFFEFIVSGGAAILTIAAMPHLDIVTNVTILNGVAIVSALLQVIAQCTAKERNRFIIPCIAAFVLLLLGYVLFLVLYITKNPTDTKMAMWVGLAAGGSILVSFNWWESYFRLISKNSSSVFLKSLCKDMTTCQNVLHIISSLLRIAVTAAVLGAYVPLSKMDWKILKSVSSFERRVIVITVGVQLIASALCHWFALAACKMHALRRCFILPLYLASLAVMALFVIPVIVYYQDYRKNPTKDAITNFSSYCGVVVNNRSQNLTGSVFPQLVLDVTHTLCFLDMSSAAHLGLLTGNKVEYFNYLIICVVHETAMIYLCATMWHETYDEMMKILISMFRLDRHRPKTEPKSKDFTFEAHIYFDDAFEHVEGSEESHLNSYAKNLVEVIIEVYGIFTSINEKFFKKNQNIPDQQIIRTSYGGRLVITMPLGNNIIVHFKDKELIRHKKRWSQIMYLYYLLGWKLMKNKRNRRNLFLLHQKEKHNTYLLALDGDTDFQPTSVMLLIDRLKMYPRVGAACGRIHPTGSGPTVWFQKFEYAVSHWLQKTAEHVIGCVLCSPGCFSLFRAAALMDDNVMKRYATKSTEASHYIQYDQGEDRWLCTLLLKQGWRVEYNAASDAYTNAPEDFKELYNQRRRWGPSTLANVVDLLGDTNVISNRNKSMSKLFMFYQLFGIISAILAPATICLLVAGSLTFIFNIGSDVALVISVIPPIVFLILCFKLKSDTQITIAGILSIIYAFLMLVVTLSIIGAMIKQQTILTPSSMFVIVMAIIYIITAIIHPQEFQLVFYGVLYIVCIPSAYLLLTIYSMVNMNNVSWGTRESKPAAGAATPPIATQSATLARMTIVLTHLKLIFTLAAKNTLQRFFSCIKCKNFNQRSQEEQLNVNQDNQMTPESAQSEPQPQNTIVEDIRIPGEEQIDEFTLTLCIFLQEEEEFFVELQEKYLKPLPDDKKRQKTIASDLKNLRNKVNFAFFMLNALWLVATFTLQLNSSTFSIKIPKIDINLHGTGEDVQIEPIGFMFILGFATSVVVQFLAMIYYRQQKLKEQDLHQAGQRVSTTYLLRMLLTAVTTAASASISAT
uniref:chitin synthase n=1 Tax=Anabas testudineus TaxID=64144 RepID=A0A3Q1K3U7_ANATE